MTVSIQTLPLPKWFPDDRKLARFIQTFLPFHRVVSLRYKLNLLKSLARLWPEGKSNVLDIGAGDGVLGTAVKRYFPCKRVTGVDVVRRLHHAADIDFIVYDGVSLPFDANSFNVVMICNVIHHVIPSQRLALMMEVSRLTSETILIKDHLARGWFSRQSLCLADWVGNRPFGAMSVADYLDSGQWNGLLKPIPFEVSMFDQMQLQGGIRRIVFPDKNEIIIRMLGK